MHSIREELKKSNGTQGEESLQLETDQFFEWQKLNSLDVHEMSQWRKLGPPQDVCTTAGGSRELSKSCY